MKNWLQKPDQFKHRMPEEKSRAIASRSIQKKPDRQHTYEPVNILACTHTRPIIHQAAPSRTPCVHCKGISDSRQSQPKLPLHSPPSTMTNA